MHTTKPINKNKIPGALINPPSTMVNDVHRRPLPVTTKNIPITNRQMPTFLFSIYLSHLIFSNYIIYHNDVKINATMKINPMTSPAVEAILDSSFFLP